MARFVVYTHAGLDFGSQLRRPPSILLPPRSTGSWASPVHLGCPQAPANPQLDPVKVPSAPPTVLARVHRIGHRMGQPVAPRVVRRAEPPRTGATSLPRVPTSTRDRPMTVRTTIVRGKTPRPRDDAGRRSRCILEPTFEATRRSLPPIRIGSPLVSTM